MIDIEGIKARLDIAENGIKRAEQAIENAKACFDKAKEMLDAKDAKPPRNWPERIEAGDCFEVTSGARWMKTDTDGILVCIRDEHGKMDAAGVTIKVTHYDDMTYLGHARDILTIRTDAHEPTGAELVGKVCIYTDDDGRMNDAGWACEVYEPGRGYSWGNRTTWYKHARLAK